MSTVTLVATNCVFTMMAGSRAAHIRTVGCNRRVLWLVKTLGGKTLPMCHYHGERYMLTHEIDPARITRLSDDDRDFVIRTEPGKGHCPVVRTRVRVKK